MVPRPPPASSLLHSGIAISILGFDKSLKIYTQAPIYAHAAHSIKLYALGYESLLFTFEKNFCKVEPTKTLKTSTHLEFCGISNNNAKKSSSSDEQSIQNNYELSKGVFYEQEIIPHT